ncbi:MAG: Antitoxin HigA [Planctomycetes bacterium ADurb.Bin126]|nr:MAG: Antitoxin HigA [Planctomycetes bacterium ADurb.Bin126]HOD82370.1 helix-turn-helix domain-containing protein [Phycisphaerae bacterium]HQL73433.1 helix-turn-helix domain-containing protein [Phycisphaerae bacterium]
MSTIQTDKTRLPGRLEELGQVMMPRAIENDAVYQETVEMIDRLMSMPKLTKGQEVYLETLVQLVQAYEASHYPIEAGDLGGISALLHLLQENGMSASDLARLLGVHVSMGSKILNGERSLTVEHLLKLAQRFRVRPELFMPRYDAAAQQPGRKAKHKIADWKD